MESFNTYYNESYISKEQLESAIIDIVAYEKKGMASGLLKEVINKDTDNVVMRISFTEEFIGPDKVKHSDVMRSGFLKIRGEMEVFNLG